MAKWYAASTKDSYHILCGLNFIRRILCLWQFICNPCDSLVWKQNEALLEGEEKSKNCKKRNLLDEFLKLKMNIVIDKKIPIIAKAATA